METFFTESARVEDFFIQFGANVSLATGFQSSIFCWQRFCPIEPHQDNSSKAEFKYQNTNPFRDQIPVFNQEKKRKAPYHYGNSEYIKG
ncbi:MAG: hypothetical protein GH155_04830 [Spirochaeta sp.]|nr:hypothetical protein [Spirochaeta sp.]